MNILNSLLETTIYSAILFGTILLFKALFKKHLSPMLSYTIWFLLIARLILPVTLDLGFRIPLMSSVQMQEKLNVLFTGKSAQASGNTALTGSNIPGAEDPITVSSQKSDGLPKGASDGTSAKPDSKSLRPASTDWAAILMSLWLGGAALSLLYFLAAYLKLMSLIKLKSVMMLPGAQKMVLDIKSQLNIHRDIKVVMVDEFVSPAINAGLHPVIILPRRIFLQSETQIAFALKHELMHFKRYDHLVCMALIFLRSIYWFNPVVWLTNRYMRMDMETACDSMVVSKMSNGDKRDYAATILGMFAYSPNKDNVLGMALVRTKQLAERRIRGVFMKSRSQYRAKIAAVLLALTMLAACFTTACQPTPTKAAVVGKGADALETKIHETATSSTTGNSTTRCDLNFTSADGKVKVSMNANAVVPEHMPVVRVQPYFIPMERVKAAVQVLFRGAEAYWRDGGMTKAEIQKTLLTVKHDLQQYVESDNALQEHYNGDQAAMDRAKARYEWQIAAYNKLYASAPEVVTRKGTDWVFHPLAYYQDVTAYGDLSGNDAQNQIDKSMLYNSKVIQLSSESDGRFGYLEADNLDTSSNVQHYLGFFSGSMFSSDGAVVPNWNASDFQPIGATQDEVMKIVQDALVEMGIQGMSLSKIHSYGKPDATAATVNGQEALNLAASSRPATTNVPAGDIYTYSFVFVPSYNGVPTVDTGRSIEAIQDQYGPTYNYETLLVNVGRVSGAASPVITSMQWNNPTQVASVENDNVKVLTLEEALEVFQNQMKREYTLDSYTSDADANGEFSQYKGRIVSAEIDISKVTLGLVRIRVANAANVYRMVPAWVFQGTEQLGVSGQDKPIDSPRTLDGAYSYVVVNALDGSIIDPSKGY